MVKPKGKEEILYRFTVACEKLQLFDSNFAKIEKSKYSIEYLETRQEQFGKLWAEVDSSYNKLLEHDTDNYSSDFSERYSTCEELYYELNASIRKSLNQIRKKSGTPNPTANSTFESSESTLNRSKFVKLPPIHIEPFRGDYETWPEFRDSFTAAVIKNELLDDSQRLYHLRDFTRDQALEIVKRYKLSNQEFSRAWEKLKYTYENKRIFANTQLKLLFSLPTVQKDSSASIKKLADTVNDCLSALKDYKINTDNWDPIIVYLVSQRLCTETLTLYEQTLTEPDEIPLWKDFNAFLQTRFRTLEVIADTKGNETRNQIVKDKPALNSQTQKKTNLKSFHTRSQFSCQICKENHGLRNCKKFLSMSPAHRLQAVKTHNCCFNCLAVSHRSHDCPSSYKCQVCKAKHNTMLHGSFQSAQSSKPSSPAQANANIVSSPPNPKPNSPETPTMQASQTVDNLPSPNAGPSRLDAYAQPFRTFFTNHCGHILLATALVKVFCNGKWFTLRSLIDPASEASFILEKTLHVLKVPSCSTSSKVTGMGNIQTGLSNKYTQLDLFSLIHPTKKIATKLFSLPNLTGALPSQTINAKIFDEYLPNLPLADPRFYESSHIDLLLGADVYPLILQDGVKTMGTIGPVMQNTIFGWVLSGRCSSNISAPHQTIQSFFTEVSLDQLIKKFWEQEEVTDTKFMSKEDKYCEDHFVRTHYRNRDGRYVVTLPLKPEFPKSITLGTSRDTAHAQLLKLEIRLSKNSEIFQMYNDVLKEYITLKHMCPVKDPNLNNFTSPNFYLPHHGVSKPSSLSTKLRVVFNASCKSSNNISLNDILYPGPALQQDLPMIILRWRLFPYVFTADIQKMYRQIWLNSSQTCLQRILFRQTQQSPIQDYELTTVTFGVNCAPFLAMRTLLQLARDEAEKYPIASKIVESDFFVDDVLSGAFSIEEAQNAQHQLKCFLHSGGFELKKWASNEPQVLKSLPVEDCIHTEFRSFDNEEAIKTLGVYWSNASDHFTFRFENSHTSQSLTKRQLFSKIAKLFDPLGWVAPVVVFAKILMQEVWKEKINWDEMISENH